MENTKIYSNNNLDEISEKIYMYEEKLRNHLIHVHDKNNGEFILLRAALQSQSLLYLH